MKTYYVYILTNPGRTLYIGITNDLVRRIHQHRTRTHPGFASRYGIDRLVYFEEFSQVDDAIAREKQLKNWRREKKVRLIRRINPEWRDLSAEWFE